MRKGLRQESTSWMWEMAVGSRPFGRDKTKRRKGRCFAKAAKLHTFPAPMRSKMARIAVVGPERRMELAGPYACRYFRKNEPIRSMPAPYRTSVVGSGAPCTSPLEATPDVALMVPRIPERALLIENV